MTQDIKFSDLIKPGEGAMAAMKKEVGARAKAERFREGRWYGGLGEILKAHGTYFTGSELPAQYDDVQGPMGKCHINALEACEAHPELRYFTGLYAAGPRITDHSWCVDPDGKVVEVTFPTKGPDTKTMRLAEYPEGEEGRPVRGTLGWTPPHTWAYCGLEFDASFVRRWVDEIQCWPLLAVDRSEPDFIARCPFVKPYSPRGYALPSEAEMDAHRLQVERMAAELEDHDDEDEGYDDGPE